MSSFVCRLKGLISLSFWKLIGGWWGSEILLFLLTLFLVEHFEMFGTVPSSYSSYPFRIRSFWVFFSSWFTLTQGWFFKVLNSRLCGWCQNIWIFLILRKWELSSSASNCYVPCCSKTMSDVSVCSQWCCLSGLMTSSHHSCSSVQWRSMNCKFLMPFCEFFRCSGCCNAETDWAETQLQVPGCWEPHPDPKLDKTPLSLWCGPDNEQGKCSINIGTRDSAMGMGGLMSRCGWLKIQTAPPKVQLVEDCINNDQCMQHWRKSPNKLLFHSWPPIALWRKIWSWMKLKGEVALFVSRILMDKQKRVHVEYCHQKSVEAEGRSRPAGQGHHRRWKPCSPLWPSKQVQQLSPGCLVGHPAQSKYSIPDHRNRQCWLYSSTHVASSLLSSHRTALTQMSA